MLSKGNAKLGKNIWTFSIPAGPTCPGKSSTCDERCYAQKGFFAMPSVQRSYKKNLRASKSPHFTANMVDEIQKRRCQVVRIHVAGDFYSAAYVAKWTEIIKAFPTVIFFAYTRSWRIPEIRKELTKLASYSNVRLWFSVDAETGNPVNVPKRVRTAYLSIDSNDIPAHSMDLVFRDYPGRVVVQKRINGIIVCPPENGVTAITCEQCGICWKKTTPITKGPKDIPSRIPLALVA